MEIIPTNCDWLVVLGNWCGCPRFYAPTSSPPPATTSGRQLADAESNPTTPTCHSESLFTAIKPTPSIYKARSPVMKGIVFRELGQSPTISWQSSSELQVAFLLPTWTLMLADNSQQQEEAGRGRERPDERYANMTTSTLPRFPYKAVAGDIAGNREDRRIPVGPASGRHEGDARCAAAEEHFQSKVQYSSSAHAV